MERTTDSTAGFQRSSSESAVKRAGASVGLVIAALIVSVGIGFVIGLSAVVGGLELTSDHISVIDMAGTQTAFTIVGLAFLARVGWQYVDVRQPTTGELRLVGGGIIAVASIEIARQVVTWYGLLAEAGTLGASEEMGATAMLVILFLVLVVAPLAEELFFRGVIQQYVSAAAGTAAGIATATVLFVPMHALGILTSTESMIAAGVVVGVLVVLSVVVGVAYHRTENLVVPIAIHAGYNLLSVGVAITLYSGSIATVLTAW